MEFENEEFRDGEVFPLSSCDHPYHKACMESYFKNAIDESKFPLVCPDPKCKIEILINELKLIIDNDYIEKY